MEREYPERPIVGVGGVVVQEGRVLLVRRGHAPLLGEWSIPGGAVEAGETLLQAVCREILEETGLEVEPVAVIEVVDPIVRDEQGRAQFHFVLIDYLCRLRGGAACAASDITECRWALADELPVFSLRPDTLRVVRKALAMATGEPVAARVGLAGP